MLFSMSCCCEKNLTEVPWCQGGLFQLTVSDGLLWCEDTAPSKNLVCDHRSLQYGLFISWLLIRKQRAWLQVILAVAFRGLPDVTHISILASVVPTTFHNLHRHCQQLGIRNSNMNLCICLNWNPNSFYVSLVADEAEVHSPVFLIWHLLWWKHLLLIDGQA